MKLPNAIVMPCMALLLCDCRTGRGSLDTNTKPSANAYVRPFAYVLYRTNASPGVIRLANQISSTYGLREAKPVRDNPVCCVWLEVKPSPSRPGARYYWVTVQAPGEAMLCASSEDMLEKAFDRLKANAHSLSGQLVVPVGSFSYYDK